MVRQVTKDSTNISVELFIIDATTGVPELGVVFNESGIDLNYRRDGAAVTTITEIDLTTPALTDAHEDGGFLEVANGRYRLDVPDAAFATGIKQVTVGGVITGMIVLPVTIQLVDFDTEAAYALASVATEVRLAELDAGNLPTDIAAIPTTAMRGTDNVPTDAGVAGAGLTDLGGMSTGMKAEIVTEVLNALTDSGLMLVKTTIATLASQTSFTLTAGSADNDAYNEMIMVITDVSTGVQRAVGWIDDYVGSTKTITLRTDPGIFTMATTDLVSILAVTPASEAAFAVWEEVLTGATHNTTNSAGRRLRQLQEAGGYTNGFVYIDTVNGSAGTTPFENGVEIEAVSNIADANTLAANVAGGLSRFAIAPGSAIVLGASQQNQEFIGTNWTLDLNGQDIAGSYFKGATVTGIGTGVEPTFEDCDLGGITLAPFHSLRCQYNGTLTLGAVGDYTFLDGVAHLAGGSAPVIDFNSLGGAIVNYRRYSGGLTANNMASGDILGVEIVSGGPITLNGANATASINGIIRAFTNNLTGSPNVLVNGLLSVSVINAEVDSALNTVIPGSPTADSINERVAAIDDAVSEVRLAELDAANLPTDIAAAALASVLGTPAGADIAADIAAVLAAITLPVTPQKNVAFANVAFKMVLTSDHVTPGTGLSITGEISKDGGAFTALANAETEISAGWYKVNIDQAEMNADVIILKFTAALADQTDVILMTDS